MRESDPFVRVLVCVFSFISTTKVVYECECVVGGLSVSSVNDFVFFFLYRFSTGFLLCSF